MRRSARRWIETGWSLALLLILPGLAVSGWLIRHGARDRWDWRAAGIVLLCLVPVVALPVLARARRGAGGEGRLLRDLGADRIMRWRLLWGPVYAPPLLLGIGLAALWLIAAAFAPSLSAWLPERLLHRASPAPL